MNLKSVWFIFREIMFIINSLFTERLWVTPSWQMKWSESPLFVLKQVHCAAWCDDNRNKFKKWWKWWSGENRIFRGGQFRVFYEILIWPYDLKYSGRSLLQHNLVPSSMILQSFIVLNIPERKLTNADMDKAESFKNFEEIHLKVLEILFFYSCRRLDGFFFLWNYDSWLISAHRNHCKI